MPMAIVWRNVLPWQVQRMAVPFFKVKRSSLHPDAPSELLGSLESLTEVVEQSEQTMIVDITSRFSDHVEPNR
jgi:hypothetical protein